MLINYFHLFSWLLSSHKFSEYTLFFISHVQLIFNIHIHIL